MLPSGGQATFDNQVGWARTYMKKAGLLESPRRSYFKITDRGLQALKTNPESINNRFLQQYPEFREFKTRSNTKAVDTEPEASNLYLESRQVGSVLIVLIRDDGRGFDTNNPQYGRSERRPRCTLRPQTRNRGTDEVPQARRYRGKAPKMSIET